MLCDIVGQMFEEKFLAKVFTPQVLLSNREVRLVFDRLAHASFMRLNPSSMDKVSVIIIIIEYTMCLCAYMCVYVCCCCVNTQHIHYFILLQLYDLMTMAFKYQVSYSSLNVI